ncbi:MAG: hypothetical protein WCT03_08690 [Candidatus Obscuribacterales bacterium]|jgi:hypothetical protein
MKNYKVLVAISLAAMCLLVLSKAVLSQKVNGCFSLWQLYGIERPDLAQNRSNFVQLVDGTVLFFAPKTLKDLISAWDGAQIQSNFLILDAKTKNLTPANLQVKRYGNSLQFGKYLVSETEMDKLTLSEDWQAVIKFCKSPAMYQSPNHKILFADGIYGVAITRLQDGTFLISGGATGDDLKRAETCKLARIFDAKTNSIKSTFHLQQDWINHQSARLPDGRVLLFGEKPGTVDDSQCAEIVVTRSKSSYVLSCIPQRRDGGTFCVDSQGRCLILGGDFDLKPVFDIECIDVSKNKCQVVGKLKEPRHYTSSPISYSDYEGSPYATCLNSKEILISGGDCWTGLEGNAPRTDAEIAPLSNY